MRKITTKIKTLLSSFTIRLFVWFWLIAITSIVSTRFISHQLSGETVRHLSNTPPEVRELRQLNNAVIRIKRSKIKNIGELSKIPTSKHVRPAINIWLKSMNEPSNIASLVPIPPEQHRLVSRFIAEQELDEPKTNVFLQTRVIGPMAININNRPFQVFISRKQHQRNFTQIVKALPYWARIAIPTLISFILCLLLAHSFSKPIRLIKKATGDLGQGDFDTRVQGITMRSDELGQLANSFNEMAAQLQQHQGAQQRLLGDVSHELRSPMTRLQMALGLAQQETVTPKAREQYLQRCQNEIKRLDEMIANVLTLSRLENTLQQADFHALNLNSLVENIIHDEQFIANEKSINISFNADKEIQLSADQNLLASAISNVLNNAVKYSPKQSIIEVQLSSTNDEVTIIITDQGDGVPEQALAQLFTPFYRVNLARDRNTGGTGLGLAIAKQAVMAHRGEIFAKNNAIKGLSVTIKIPH